MKTGTSLTHRSQTGSIHSLGQMKAPATQRIAIFVAFLHFATPLIAADLTLIGTHPTSRLTVASPGKLEISCYV